MPEERKLVTILFADVTNSTQLGDTLDPEDVRTLMGRYYTHARHIISGHGGTLEKFIGDAVMAIFGLPHAHSDDAERALAAALALRAAIIDDPLLGKTFTLRMGVNTGEVVASNDPSTGDFLVTGDAVNIAARLQQRAAPGEILVGDRTRTAARFAFHFDAARLLEIRGKKKPVQVHSLSGIRKVRLAEHPPLVGRRQDLLQLSLLQTRTLEEQRPQLASIIAPAGTGKTRLLEEFLLQLDPADGFRVATVRCLPYGQNITYWPLRGLLNDLLGDEVTKAQIEQVFCDGGYEAREAAKLADFILATLGMEKECAGERDCIFSAWRQLIEVRAQSEPLVIVFEDLHWASDSLLDLVEYLLQVHIQAALLFVTLSRPELLDRRPNWGGGRPNFTSLALQPLTSRQTRNLVAQLHAPEELREKIIERSGGNPFFALELVRGVMECIRNDSPPSLDTLPDTVHAAILARLDHVTARERQVLQVASVSTRTIRPVMLQAALENFSEQDLEAALDDLLARDFIVQAEAGSFAFRHMLIRDVAYGTLSRSERIRLHSKFASSLESMAGEHLNEYTELIAYHYRQSVQLARQSAIPIELPMECQKALYFLRRAGQMAGRAGAFSEARNHLESAIEIAPESMHTTLYEELGDSLKWGTRAKEAYKCALERWRRVEGAESPAVGARLLRKLMICDSRGYSFNTTITDDYTAMIEEAYRLAELAGSENELWHIRIADFFIRGCHLNDEVTDLPEKKQILQSAIAYFEEHKNWEAFSEALDAYAVLNSSSGYAQEGLAASQRRLTAPDLPAIERGDAFQMIAKSYLHMGEFHECIETIKSALRNVHKGQPVVHFGSGISHATAAAYTIGRWDIVDELTPALHDLWEQTQFDQSMIFVLHGFFDVLKIALARENRETIESVTSILTRVFPDEQSQPRLLLSALLAGTPQFPLVNCNDSYWVLLHYLPFCSEHNIAYLKVMKPEFLIKGKDGVSYHVYLDIARALASSHMSQLADAIEAAEERQMIVHAARMRVVLAQRTGDHSHLEKAYPVLKKLGDREFLRRLEEVRTSIPGHVA